MYADDMPTELGEFIERRRKVIGLKQYQVAERAGMSRQHLNNYVNGKNAIPPPDVLARIAAALEVTEAELLHAVGYMQDSEMTEARLTLAARRQPDELAKALRAVRAQIEAIERGLAPGGNTGNTEAGPQSAEG